MAAWKSISKIDAHIHILPEDVITANQGVEDPFILAGGVEAYVSVMEENNIFQAILMPFNDPCLMSMEFTAAAVHRNMMTIQKRYPGRFLLFADIDPQNGTEDTLTELDAVMATGAFAGIKIHPANAGMPLDGSYFDAVFSYAEGKGIPVEIHSYPHAEDPEDFCGPDRLSVVLARHPKLRVSVAHMGGLQCDKLIGLDVFVNFSASLPELVKRHGIDETNRILRQFGTDRLIFGTDYPDSRCICWESIYQEYFKILDQMDFSEEEMAAICRENILRFLNQR